MAKKTYSVTWCSSRSVPWIPPAPLLGALFTMDYLWRFVPDTHVRPFCIVKKDYTAQFFLTFLDGWYLHLVEPFGLDYPVSALGYGIFKRVTTLCHAYHHITLLQFCDIGSTDSHGQNDESAVRLSRHRL